MPTGNNSPSVTILHVSDTQFGQYHRFGTEDSLARNLIRDLERLKRDERVPEPDLMILSGDITERANEDEFADALAFLDEVCAITGLSRERVVVVPGNHDVSWSWSEAHFYECRAKGKEFAVPYFPKWENYQRFVTELHDPTAFTAERPYRLHRFDELRVAVAAMNSTIKESHRDDDHYGWCGDGQLRWFARELGELDGMLRIGVLHHNVRRKAVADNENLRDEDALSDILRDRLDLILHGHTHAGKEDRLPNGTLVLATGSAAVTEDWRPGETRNQYQVLRVDAWNTTRWAREWDGVRDWMPDIRADPERRRTQVPVRLIVPGWNSRRQTADEVSRFETGELWERWERGRDFAEQVVWTTQQDLGKEAQIHSRRTEDPPLRYLLVHQNGRPLRYVGIVDGPLDRTTLEDFDRRVFGPARVQHSEFVLVHRGPDEPELREHALVPHGIRVKTWNEYNALLDCTAYRTWLKRELDNDRLYPQKLYQPQRYRDIDRFGGAESEIRDDLLDQVSRELLAEDGCFVLVLGDAGYGKSFLVRRLAHRMLDNDRLGITPIVVYLKDRDKRQTVAEMVSNVLIPSNTSFAPDHFRHSLEAGSLALLIDGYDEFAVRVGYDNAAAQLRTFLDAAKGRARILLTTRPSHFRSTENVTSSLFASLQTVHHGRVRLLEPFDDDQQRAFLRRWFELEGAADPVVLAGEWMAALRQVDNLPELARTPRMLSFIVKDLRLEEIRSAVGRGVVTAADLYDRLVSRWLSEEAARIDPAGRGAVSEEQRRELLEEIALRLWQAGERDVTEDALQQAVRDVLDLPGLELTVDQAAQIAGSRTLLQVGDGCWKFTHQSVWEFLLASHLATFFRAGRADDLIGDARLTPLTGRFLRDLAPESVEAWLDGRSGDDPEDM